MKRKKYINRNEKIKCYVGVEKKIPDSTYSMRFKIDSNLLLRKSQNYISKDLNDNDRLKLNDYIKKETDKIIPIINRHSKICTSLIFPSEQEQYELFQNACSKSFKYCYTNREEKEQETLTMLQNEGIENYIKRAKEEGLIDDDRIQNHYNTWNSNKLFDEETRNFYTYLDIYSEVEAKRKCYLCFLPQIYEKAIIDKVGNNIEDYIFSKVKEDLKAEILDSFYKYLGV